MADVNIDFSNNGEEIIIVNYDDVKGSPQSFVVRPEQIVRRALPIGHSFYFTLSRGRFSKNTTYAQLLMS